MKIIQDNIDFDVYEFIHGKFSYGAVNILLRCSSVEVLKDLQTLIDTYNNYGMPLLEDCDDK